MFKIRRSDSTSGYASVVQPLINLGTASALLSLYFPSRWGRTVKKAELVHYMSPHFFHLVKYNPNATGTVHDLIFLDPTTFNKHDTPLGTRHFFPRVLKHTERLRGVTVISAVTREALRRVCPKVEATVIHNWTDERFQPRNREEARLKLGLPIDKRILLQVSIDNVRKNLEILPRIINELDPSYILIRIGESGRIRSQFPKGRFFSIDHASPELYPWYFNAADALLMPSREEGFGRPLIEAINSGIPAVCSDIEIFREVLKGPYPYLADPDDLPRWVELTKMATERRETDIRGSQLYSKVGSYYRAERAYIELRAFFQRFGLDSPPDPHGPRLGSPPSIGSQAGVKP